MELIIAMTYGQALFDAAKEIDKIDQFKEELEAIDQILGNEPQYLELLCNPAIPCVKKKTMVREVFEGRIMPEILSFIFILLDKNRMTHYGKIVREFEKIMEKYRGEGTGIIYSTVPLSEEQLEKFQDQAGKLLLEKIKLENIIDKSLIGGVKLFVDGKYVDASLRGRLEKLKYKLKEN